jgi:cysteine desulfurase
MNMKRIYLDYASTTPIDKKVWKAMKPYFQKDFYNPSAIYKEGVEVKKKVNEARATIARILNAQASDIIFTGNGTESINLAIRGTVEAFRKKNPEKIPHIITSVIEHSSTLEVCRSLEMEAKALVTYLLVDKDGKVKAEDVEKALRDETILVTIMYANNEIGTIEPIKEIARRVKLWKIDKKRNAEDYPFIHTDASQAGNYCLLDREKLGIDMMTLDGHKIYGPKGIALLYIKKYIPCVSIVGGGGQENGLRPGTENVSAIIGMAKALEITQKIREEESARLTPIQDYFITELLKIIPQTKINGSREDRLPNNINFCIPNVNAEFLVLLLDAKGIACASLSSCENLNSESISYVVGNLPDGEKCSRSSIRLSMGRATRKRDLKVVLKILPGLVSKAKFA